MARVQVPKPNLLDRAFAWVAPVAAARRMRARIGMAALSGMAGGYNGARKSRTASSEWALSSLSADAALLPDLPTLREASRDLERNAPLAGGAIATVVTNVVGSGLKMRAQIDRDALGLGDDAADTWEREAERLWSLWATSQESDFARTLRFGAIQRQAFRAALSGGDCFVVLRHKARAGSPFALKLQTMEGDRVSNPNRGRDTDTLAGGVELDAETGAPVAYHVTDRHPGDGLRSALTWNRVPAFGPDSGRRLVLHLFRAIRPEQRRGVPYLAPVIESLKQLTRYSEAEIMAAVITSCFAIVTKTPNGMGGEFEDANATKKDGGKIDLINPGQMVDLAPDESLENFAPERPNVNFDPFVMAILRQIGVALELPFEVLIKHFTASYSAARAALLEAGKFFREYRSWLAEELCQPVYEEFIGECVARGLLAAPGFFADPLVARAWCGAAWIGPAPGQIDPGKEADANATMVDRGWKTDAEVTAEMTGGDWERNAAQRKKEIATARDAGMREEAIAERIATEPKQPEPPPSPDKSDTETE